MAFVPLSLQTVFNDGYAVRDARLYAYEAGTTTPRVLYRTAALDPTQQHTHPVRADGAGRIPQMWTGVGSYDLRITDADGSVIEVIRGLQGDPVPSSGGTAIDPLRQLPTGALVAIHSTGRRAGWVRANGETIGSAASAGAERANDDCYALFVLLWDDPHQTVDGGRGQSAQADWDAARTITLPDYQGRVVMGALNMGNASAAANRLAGGLLASDGAVLGATGGEAAHATTVAEMPPHAHDATVSMDDAGEHDHTVTINEAPGHIHGVRYQASSVYGNGGSGAVFSVGNDALANSDGFTQEAGRHSHTSSVSRNGTHKHNASATVQSVGGGGAHNNLQPFGVATIYIKL